MEIIEKKFKTNELPVVGDKEVAGEKALVQATGVRFKQQPVTKEYYLDLDKKYFIAKDGKGSWINGKIS
jgi:homospermidine synthase